MEHALRLVVRAAVVLAVLVAAQASAQMVGEDDFGPAPVPEERDGAFAILAHKILTAVLDPDEPQVIDRGVVLVEDGRIVAVGRRDELAIPRGYAIVDAGERWLMPGLVELHCHSAHPAALFPENNINDAVLPTNTGMRASSVVVPDNVLLRRGVAGGVTTVLFIPGSASNIGGQGVLLKIGFRNYEDMLLRDPGSLKLAQAGNPESFAMGVGRCFMNWNTRRVLREGLEHAEHRAERAAAGEELPKPDPDLEVFDELLAKRTQVSVHTQVYQVVLTTLTMLRAELGLDVYLDHSTIGGWRTGALAAELGVPAIVGPRSVDTTERWFIDWAKNGTEGIRGVAAGYQELGHDLVGFNTDCFDDGRFGLTPPQEELSLQAAMALRYGMTNANLESIRGLTIIPAYAAGIDHRVGSIEPGKDADLVVIDGDPADPRSSVYQVFTNGRVVYDVAAEERRW